MLSRLSSASARTILPAVATSVVAPACHSVRTYATLKEVERRLKSINNIEKITKTMKIVASTRLSKAQKAEAAAKKLDEADQQFFETAATKDAKPTGETTNGNKELIVAISSDKGLCGSIHSSLAKAVRNYIASNKIEDCDIVTIGDKMKMQLMRSHQANIKLSFSGIGKDAPSFLESSLISSKLIEELDVANRYNKVSIFFNNPVSSLSFQSDLKPVYNPDLISNSPNYNRFEIDPEGNLPTDLFEYNLTNQILSAMSQGYSAEISARRNAMDNASKNAAEMINNYSIIYNRTRQAAITNELVDIITGASSLD